MSLGVVFALLSLLSAGLSDVVFKKYCNKERSRGMYICGIGLVWTVLQLIMLNIDGQSLVFNHTTLVYGAAAGVVVALANILLLECLTHLDVSLGSTIYRLNTIGVVLMSFMFLGESLGWLKVLGIMCGVVGVLILYQRKQHLSSKDVAASVGVFLVVAIVAALFRASYGVVSKAGISDGADPATMMFMSALSWVLFGLIYAAVREKRVRFSVAKLRYSIVSGVLIFAIVNFLIKALEYGEASVLVPIANTSFVVALLISVLLKMESLSLRKGIAVVCAVLSIFVLAQSGA